MPAPDDDPIDDLDLELAMRLDALADEFRRARALDPDLSPADFAALHPDVGGALLPMLSGMVALAGATAVEERRVAADAGVLPPGTRVGPYEIVGVLGRGGMGVVYEAAESGLGRSVALKAIRLSDGNERFRARFVREGRAAAKLDHPSIVPVLGAGEDGDVLWYAMRLVRGESLDRLLASMARGPEPEAAAARRALERSGSDSDARPIAGRSPAEQTAARLALDLARALDVAHAEGILHRDVKPGNVLVEDGGGALLTDFGLCKLEGDASLTSDSDVVGTLRYLPPEAMRGGADARGDVYGVGLILYELVALRPAFEADARHALVDRILHHDPAPLGQAVPGTSEDLGRIVRKATAKLPDERYPTAAALAADLEAFLDGRPVEARAPSALYLARLFVRRNRAFSALAALSLLVVSLLTAVYIVQLRDAFDEAEAARSSAEASRTSALLATAEATLRTNDVRGARAALEAVPAEDRGWLWRHFSARVDPPEFVATAVSGSVARLTRAPEGRILEIGRLGAALRDAATFEPVSRFPERIVYATPFNDGAELVVLKGLRRELVHLTWTDGPEPEVRSLGQLSQRQYQMAVAEVQRLVLVADYDGGLEARSLDGDFGEVLWRHEMGGRISAIAPMEPGGAFVGFADGRIVCVDRAGVRPYEGEGHSSIVTALNAVAGELLASADGEGNVLIRPGLTDGETLRARTENWIVDLAVNATGTTIAAPTMLGDVSLIDARTGARQRHLTGLASAIDAVAWTNGGWLLATDDGKLQRYGLGAHTGRVDLTPALSSIVSVTTTGPGSETRRLLAPSNDGFLHVHDLDAGTVDLMPFARRRGSGEVALSEDGRLAAVSHLVYDLEEGRLLAQLDAGERVVFASTFGPNGDLVLLGRDSSLERSGIHLWRVRREELEDGTARGELLGSSPDILDMWLLGAHHDAERGLVYAASGDGRVQAFSLEPFARVWEARPEDALITASTMSPETDELLVATAAGRVHAIDLEDPTRSRSAAIGVARSGLRRISSLALGPAAGTFAACQRSGRIDLYDLASFERVGTLAADGSGFAHVSMDSRSGWLVAAAASGRLSLLGHGEPPTIAVSEWGEIGLAAWLEALEEPEGRAAAEAVRKDAMRQLSIAVDRAARLRDPGTLGPKLDQLRAQVPGRR